MTIYLITMGFSLVVIVVLALRHIADKKELYSLSKVNADLEQKLSKYSEDYSTDSDKDIIKVQLVAFGGKLKSEILETDKTRKTIKLGFVPKPEIINPYSVEKSKYPFKVDEAVFEFSGRIEGDVYIYKLKEILEDK